MSTVVVKELFVTSSNAQDYCTAKNLQLNDGTNNAFRLYLDTRTDGWAILNDEAKALLYPTSTARPFQIDSSMCGSRSAGTMYTFLEFNDIAVHEVKFTSSSDVTKSQEGIVHDEISNSTIATKIAWHIDGSSTVSAFRVRDVNIKLYFYQYSHQGVSANRATGIKNVLVSSSEPYHGDLVIYSAELEENSTWYGWYSDPEHTQLVSTEETYEIEADSDITLYAYATKKIGLFVKINGESTNAIGIYQKKNGDWKEIDKNDINDSIPYKRFCAT